MRATIGTHVFNYPAGPDELRLGQWVEFLHQHGLVLDERANDIKAMDPGRDQMLASMALYADRAFAVLSFFGGIPLDQVKVLFPVPAVTQLYRESFAKCFVVPDGDDPVIRWDGIEYILPDAQLSQASAMTFGEVVDSKAMSQNAKLLEWTRWELIQMLCAMFLRPDGVPYEESLSYIGGVASDRMAMVPMRIALQVSSWYESLNRFLEENFTIFQDSSIKSGNFMKKHFAAWGWVNFLKSIAKTKVFDIPGSGMNSIQCARVSKAYDVLMYASEEKEYGEALNADYEAKNPPPRR